MAPVKLTLSHKEVLQVLTGNRDEEIKSLLERILNEVMNAESEEQLSIKWYQALAEMTGENLVNSC